MSIGQKNMLMIPMPRWFHLFVGPTDGPTLPISKIFTILSFEFGEWWCYMDRQAPCIYYWHIILCSLQVPKFINIYEIWEWKLERINQRT